MKLPPLSPYLLAQSSSLSLSSPFSLFSLRRVERQKNVVTLYGADGNALTLVGTALTLVGTAHVSKKSVALVKKTI